MVFEEGEVSGVIDFGGARGGWAPFFDVGPRLMGTSRGKETDEQKAFLRGYGISLSNDSRVLLNQIELALRLEVIEHTLIDPNWESFMLVLGDTVREAIR